MILKNKFETIEIDDSIMMIPIGTESNESKFILRLNSSAKKILDALNEEISEENLIEIISKEYDTPEENISEMIKDFLTELVDNNLVE